MDAKFDDFAKRDGRTDGQMDTPAYTDAIDASKNIFPSAPLICKMAISLGRSNVLLGR